MRDRILGWVESAARRLGKSTRPSIREYAVPESQRHELLEASKDNPLAEIFYRHEGRIAHKWTHYFEAYHRHLGHLRGKDFRLLELGVFKGGSLELWRKYFGPKAVIYGIDIDPQCAGYVDEPNQVRIGSQADPMFLRLVVNEMRGLDVVIDDGSHKASHQRASFEVLFPLLSEGGLYLIEDTHTSYWAGFCEGGYRRKGTAIEFGKSLIDDMHGHYHFRSGGIAKDWIPAIHFYDSMIVIEKKRRGAPAHIQVG